MEKSKENKVYETSRGITLIPLLITAIVMLIIVGIALGNGLQSADNARLQSFFKELQIIQKRVDVISEEAKNGTSQYITYDPTNKTFSSINVGESVTSTDKIDGVEDQAGYYRYNKDDLDKLGIKNVEQEVYINWKTRDVVSVYGFTINESTKDEVTYYRDPSVFKPEYQENEQQIIVEEENIKITGKSIKQVQVVNLKTSSGQAVENFEMKYREYNENNENSWKIAESNSFQTAMPGEYQLQISVNQIVTEPINITLVPEFEVTAEQIKTDKWRYTITQIFGEYKYKNVVYKYREEGTEEWNSVIGNTFETTQNQNYEIKAWDMDDKGQEEIGRVIYTANQKE